MLDVLVCIFLLGGVDLSVIIVIVVNVFKESGKGFFYMYFIDYEDNDKFFKVNEF